ncbi:MAG: ribbon-helix-helix domain-containing protein [Thermoplasmatota archaeon]
MSKMVPVDVQFTQEELERIDRSVEKRGYGSRSEYIRDVVSKHLSITSLEDISEKFKELDVTEEELEESIKEAREESWGED